MPPYRHGLLAFLLALGAIFPRGTQSQSPTDNSQPFNFKQVHLEDEFRAALTITGYRFDEETGLVLSGKTKKPVTRAEMAALLQRNALIHKHVVLQRLHNLLGQEHPSQPLSPEIQERARALAEKAALPPELVEAVKNAQKIPAAALQSQVESLYLDSTRFWDKQGSLWEFLKTTLPVVPGWNDNVKPPPYFDDMERKLGSALAADVSARISRYQPGRDILKKFQSPAGKDRLVSFLVLKIHPTANASYFPGNKSVFVNHDYILKGMLSAFPRADRPRLKKELADPKKFAQYLLDHPETRAAFVARNEMHIVHELTHAWQDKRDGFISEERRGTAAGGDQLEYEHEAYLEGMRYFHAKLMEDPESAAENYAVENYRLLLFDFDQWRNEISENYFQNSPQAAVTFPMLASIQDQRVGMARRLMGEDLHQQIAQRLKILGIRRGSAALAQAKSDHERRMDIFVKKEHPRMRYAGQGKLAELFAAQGRRDEALAAYQQALAAAREIGDKKLLPPLYELSHKIEAQK